MRLTTVCLLALLALGHLLGALPALGNEYWVYYGTYTRGQSRGIYVGRFQAETGELSPPALAAETANPSFLALHPAKPLLYAVSELYDVSGERVGAVSAFEIDAQSGMLRLINRQPSGGAGPCHLVVDKSGRFVLVANYGGGSVAVLPLAENGALLPASCVLQQEGRSVHPTRQTRPHAHQIDFNPTGRLVLVPDLGLDMVLLFDWHPAEGKLTPHGQPFVPVPAGAGPRHFAFHPSGRYLYVLNELTTTVGVYVCDEGIPQHLVWTVSALPPGFAGQNTAAEIAVHPSGRFVYTSNRGHDSVAVFAVLEDGRRLELRANVATGGKTPRFIGLDPAGRYLLAANQDTDNVVVFRVDQETGLLERTGQEVSVGAPVCLMFWPITR